MDSLQTWIVVGIVSAVGLFILHFFFKTIGSLVKWGITIAILVFLFGWGAVSEVPSKIWNGIQQIGNTKLDIKINGQTVSCTITPTVTEANTLLEKTRSAIDSLLGDKAKDVEITVIESKDCTGKATLQFKSANLDTVNRIKDDIQKLIPNLPITILQK
jgi:hypothetical protein